MHWERGGAALMAQWGRFFGVDGIIHACPIYSSKRACKLNPLLSSLSRQIYPVSAPAPHVYAVLLLQERTKSHRRRPGGKAATSTPIGEMRRGCDKA